jgi:hypothetical protein
VASSTLDTGPVATGAGAALSFAGTAAAPKASVHGESAAQSSTAACRQQRLRAAVIALNARLTSSSQLVKN